MSPVITRERLRLRCAEFYVDLRLLGVDGRWMAVADTPDGPSVGWGPLPINAAIMALEPFEGVLSELLSNVSPIPPPSRLDG